MYSVEANGERPPAIVQVMAVREPSKRTPIFEGQMIRPGELEGLAAVLADSGLELSESLVQRVISEAGKSDLLAGVNFENCSPLASPASSDLEAFNRSMGRISELVGGHGSYPRVEFVASSSDAQPVVTVAFDGTPVGALTFHPDAFVIAVDRNADDLEVRVDPFAFDTRIANRGMRGGLKNALPEGTISQAIVWRLYSGTHSNSTDGITEGWKARIDLATVVGPAILVGRLVMFAHGLLRRDKNDPFYRFRRASGEEQQPYARDSYPAIETVRKCGPEAVIAIHGTMASAVDLASALVDELGQHRLVLRFEHDTWLTIPDNVDELVSQIERLGITKVTFVSHSRGGLVARGTMEALAGSNRVTTNAISLGSPFKGTPIVDGVDGGLLGLTALMGVLKAVGGTAGFVANRLAGMLIRFRIPNGIQEMSPSSSYLRAFTRITPDTLAFAGAIDAQAARASNGLAKNFASGFATGVFKKEKNDYVVSTASSSFLIAPANVTDIESDHFSYLDSPEVRKAFRAIQISNNHVLDIER